MSVAYCTNFVNAGNPLRFALPPQWRVCSFWRSGAFFSCWQSHGTAVNKKHALRVGVGKKFWSRLAPWIPPSCQCSDGRIAYWNVGRLLLGVVIWCPRARYGVGCVREILIYSWGLMRASFVRYCPTRGEGMLQILIYFWPPKCSDFRDRVARECIKR